MDWISDLVATGRIADLILVTLALEAASLALLDRVFARGPGLAPYLGQILSGACLVLAMRLALTDAHPLAIAGCLCLSFVVHAVDLFRRGPW